MQIGVAKQSGGRILVRRAPYIRRALYDATMDMWDGGLTSVQLEQPCPADMAAEQTYVMGTCCGGRPETPGSPRR